MLVASVAEWGTNIAAGDGNAHDLSSRLAGEPARPYMASMPFDPDLKRLRWRAHHRGTKEADLLIGGFFDAHHAAWDEHQRVLFGELLESQDVDIMAWAVGTAAPPERFAGPMIDALKKLDFIRIER